jgi:prepilin-type processing-associated H-X9-DG protein
VIDSEAPMGMGATRVIERVAAAVGGLQEATIEFEATQDVPCGGVLWALPALLSNGLLHRTREYFQLPKGYYSVINIFLLLGMMALARIRSTEQLRYCSPGEWGKLLGLDRIPEVRTVRRKLKQICGGDIEQWSAELSRQWMEAHPEIAGILYVDGHVRVYHGEQTKLPKRYVARERLCLRGTTDYWVINKDSPFFSFLRRLIRD